MHNIKNKSKNIVLLGLICFLLLTSLYPVIQGSELSYTMGFDKGPSYTNVVPMEKITFVGFDEDSYIDDYAYLSAVPTSVFRDQTQNRLFSNPLLFYQEKMDFEDDKYRSLNAYEGIKYFMDDWMGYSNYELDQITLINVEKDDLDPDWESDEYIEINSDDVFELSKEIALNDWSYSKDAVVAVIQEDFEETEKSVANEFTKTLNPSKVKHLKTFDVDQTNKLNPVSEFFEVGDEYKFITAEAWWDGILVGGKMYPTGDPDLQLYCKKDDKWMQSVATAMWNIYRPAGYERTQSYVYTPGDWRISITDFPTESDAQRRGIADVFEIQGSLLNFLKPKVTYHVDISLFPGMTFDFNEEIMYGCRDAEFNLTWEDPSVVLGFCLIGPGGEVIHTQLNEKNTKSQEMTIELLGQCLEDENYQICVFALDDISRPIDFTIKYTLNQEITQEQGNSLSSATEGAVLASSLNAPLLYTSAGSLSQATKDALYKLGVENIYLVNIGKNLIKTVKDDLESMVNVKETYVELKEIYDDIREISGSNDVVFTTIDPWTQWYVGELKPANETKAGLYIGPAAYTAAHHGTPVLIIDNHPMLSSASVWPTDFWHRHASERYDYKPSVAEMSLCGFRIYDFLKEYGFDQIGDETIITVAGQYDIGIPWDRIFPGVANSGRICGTPVDTSVIISRNMFYPALIFENPALQGQVTLINGSISSRDGVLGLFKPPLLNTLHIQRQSSEEQYEYPTLCSFVTHKYRFNERASNYYGSKYECADGKIPGDETTMQPIDQGVNKKYTDDDGMYFPDMTETEVVPFYLNKGGFDTAFSTELNAVVKNLNRGVILWIHASHGTQPNGGQTLFWDVKKGFTKHNIAGIFAGAKYEENPWRGYDWYMGSTAEPDTMSMDMYGYLPFTNHNSLLLPATGMDWVLARKPIREFLNKLIPFIDPFETEDLYDGLTGTVEYSKYALANKNATQIEENLGNIHSVGFITSICQTSNTYLHLMMIRHGSVFQVQDPWPTSWYGAIWRQSIPRDIILGYTVGEAYTRGISHVGILYIGGGEDGPQWWWDDGENVVYYGDPDLRMFVPNTEYSSENYWEKEETVALSFDQEANIDGHMPFGAVDHPKQKQPIGFFEDYIFVLVIIAIIVILLIAIALKGRKK